MKYTSDHDGKSKTASAVDEQHYPEQDEVENPRLPEMGPPPSHDEIARKAFELWSARNGAQGTAEQDWLQAEQQLISARSSREREGSRFRAGGSVQC